MLYASFKYGWGEVQRGERRFTDLDEAGTEQLCQTGELVAEHVWQTADQRPGRGEECWLNALLRAAPDVQK